MIEARALWELKNVLAGSARAATSGYPAAYSHMDPDGTHWVTLQGSDEPIPATGIVTSGISEGDYILVSLDNGTVSIIGNSSNPSVGSSVTKLLASNAVRAAERTAAAIKAARKIAEQAKRVADAVGQYVWSGDDGLHVTETPEDDFKAEPQGRNVLLNAYGFLLREAETWLASFTEGATAFYDGLGNEAANIVAQFGADGARIGRIGMNRIELSEDGLVQFTDAGVIGIMAGLSATNHTVDVVTNPGTVRFDDVYYYKTSQHDDIYARKTVNAEYPFRSGYPATGVDKLLFRVEHRAVVSGSSSLSTSYEVAVPFGTSYSWQMPNTSFYLRWIVGSQGKGLQIIKETAGPYGASHMVMRVYCIGYTTEGQLRSPVLLFGEHSDMGAPGLYAVALGQGSSSEGDNAFTAGIATNAASEAQTAIGKYNENDPDNAFEVGNGTADDARSNALAVKWDGTICPNDVPMVDYIIEQGTDGIWTYRKWSSGIAECWGTRTESIAVNLASAAYGGYRSPQQTEALPDGLFSATPCATGSFATSQGAWLTSMWATSKDSLTFYLSCGSSLAAADRPVNISVHGRWE